MLRYVPFNLLAVPLLFLASFSLAAPAGAATPAAAADPAAILETKMALRDLWVEHVFWIRSYVLAADAGDEAQRKVAEDEVVNNAKALAATITPFYGQAAADGLLKVFDASSLFRGSEFTSPLSRATTAGMDVFRLRAEREGPAK